MNKVGYILDSTCVVNAEVVKKYDISFVSLNLTIDGDDYRAMDINEDEFRKTFLTYDKVTSASPSPHDFEVAILEKFAQGYEEVLIITISSRLSTTYNVALMALDALPDELQGKVFVHDSLYGSVGFDPLFASLESVISQNPDAKTVIAALEDRREQSYVLFEINDLKHLFQGGRLNFLKYFISVALKIKPLVELKDGVLSVIGKNRNRNKTLDLLFARVDELVKKFNNVFIGLFAYNTEDSAFQKLVTTIKERWQDINVILTERLCPVFMTHVGVEGYALSIVAYN